ncbi:hypothetical protein ACTFIR_001317 [Dictyostelium discoideum]
MIKTSIKLLNRNSNNYRNYFLKIKNKNVLVKSNNNNNNNICKRNYNTQTLSSLNTDTQRQQQKQQQQQQQQLFKTQQNNIESSIDPILNDNSNEDDLEIKDPLIIFNTVWNKLEQKYGANNMRFPQEIILVAGAPGSGKGTNTPFMSSVRGITADPIVMSSLLNNEEAKKIKSSGGMVSDSNVLELFLEELRKPCYRSGVVVDGFPRTNIQVELTNALYEKMKQMRKVYYNTPLAPFFPRPIFRVTVLFVGEKESVDRQLRRGDITRETNVKLKEQGLPLLEERDTDLSEEAARKRYKIFRDHYSTLQTLKKHFPFSIIDASKSLDKVQQSIIKEFKYQSSLELSQETYDLVQRIPLVTDIIQHARVDLITRLDEYQNRHNILFTSVVHVIEKEFLPTIRRQAIAGSAMLRITNSIFSSSLAIDMALDLLSERGFRVTFDIKTTYIPRRIDPITHEITNLTKQEYQFKLDFEKPAIRDLSQAVKINLN